MDLSARIKGIRYKPLLCRKLETLELKDLGVALASYGSFILSVNKDNKVAVSWWVSAKRTRSYPYARVYDTLGFTGRRIAIIPIFKDEGKEGDRDFLQWDTISLMSLLGIYVIIAYYVKADRSERYRYKITHQRFDTPYLKDQINNILTYQSDALHWNLSHAENAGKIGQKALAAYELISKDLKIEMHLKRSAEKRVTELLKSKNDFIKLSRMLAEKAQRREVLTIQPKENLAGTKSGITIQNYLGGYYYFTSDEIEIDKNRVFLIEGKHSKTNSLPSLEDIKDALLKMILFTNLENVTVDRHNYKSSAVLKLSVENRFSEKNKYLLAK